MTEDTCSRRRFLQAGASALAIGLSCSHTLPAIADPVLSEPAAALDADAALKKLLAGNQRYVAKQLLHPDQTGERLTALATSQHPFAVILGCADSRVPPEIVFDQGLGDLFVIRVAGNILDDAVLGSIEYATEELGVPLVVVLGHERCGAVTAAVKHLKVPGHVSTLVAAIQPAVEQAKPLPGDLLDNAVRANVQRVVAEMKVSQPIAAHLQRGNLQVVGARYDLDSGAVEVIA